MFQRFPIDTINLHPRRQPREKVEKVPFKLCSWSTSSCSSRLNKRAALSIFPLSIPLGAKIKRISFFTAVCARFPLLPTTCTVGKGWSSGWEDDLGLIPLKAFPRGKILNYELKANIRKVDDINFLVHLEIFHSHSLSRKKSIVVCSFQLLVVIPLNYANAGFTAFFAEKRRRHAQVMSMIDSSPPSSIVCRAVERHR